MGQPQSTLIPNPGLMPFPPLQPLQGLLPIPVDRNREPQPGDHIYGVRGGGLYQHHGIYVGDGMVIHLQGAAKKIGAPPSCQKCGDKRVWNGEIVKTCLDCFLDGQSLKFYEYGVSVVEFHVRKRGTCSVSHSKPAHEVIKIATDFLERQSDFGPYDLFANNCEDFAVYCKTGKALSMQVVGHVESAAQLAAIPFIIGRGRVAGPVGLAASVAVPVAFGIAKAITDAQRRP